MAMAWAGSAEAGSAGVAHNQTSDARRPQRRDPVRDFPRKDGAIPRSDSADLTGEE
jgi:hypothetical protein